MPAPKGHAPYNVNGEGGCPPKYTDTILDALADELDSWIDDENQIWLKDFFIKKRIDFDYADQFCNRHERFCLAYKRAKNIQEGRIFKGGLKNKFNSKVVGLGLMHNHGWKEQSKTEISGDSDNPLKVLMNHSKELVSDNVVLKGEWGSSDVL